MFVYHFCFWFLLLVFVLFVICFKMFLCVCVFFFFFFSACCLILNHKIWFSYYLHLIFLLFWGVCLSLEFCISWYSATYQKHLSKNGNLKIPKMKNAEKERTFWQEQFAQVCSQTARLFLLGVFSKLAFLLKTQKNIVASAKKRKNDCQNWSKVVLKMGPRMLCNIIGPVFNTTFWASFWGFCLFRKILFFL